jgi:PPOX class probable F420-dependent enzyme
MAAQKFPSQITTFLQKPNIMVFGTLRKDSSIQMSPVWFEYVDGVFRVSTTTERAKYKNIKRNNRVTFVIYDKDNPYQYLSVRGTAALSKDGEHDLIDRLSERYTGQTPYPADPDHKEDRVIVSITPVGFTQMGF